MKSEIERAKEFCVRAHEGQFRRDGITPYHTHPFAVAEKVADELKPAAYLHDVIEDTKTRLNDLMRFNFSVRTIIAVQSLSRRADETYNQYISRLIANHDAVLIKIADMEHNLSCQPSQRSTEKCAMWLPILKAISAKYSTARL